MDHSQIAEETAGKLNYRGYCQATGGVSLITGDKLPEFENLKPEIQKAWIDAARTVMDFMRGYYLIKDELFN